MAVRRVPAIGVLCLWAGAVAGQGLNPSTAEIDAFVIADRNKDQLLDPGEFQLFVDQMARRGQSTARTIRFWGAYGYAFGVADANGDGGVAPMELRTADNAFRGD